MFNMFFSLIYYPKNRFQQAFQPFEYFYKKNNLREKLNYFTVYFKRIILTRFIMTKLKRHPYNSSF